VTTIVYEKKQMKKRP